MAELQLARVARVDLDRISSVYGPVRSWRVGMSLGIDPLCLNSICSFNCTYCQLGFIQVRINERHCFVSVAKVLEDLKTSAWREADIITFSGSGEPTLALNLGELIGAVKGYTGKPVLVLTNGTLLHQAEVQRDLQGAEKVFLKLDAASEQTFRRINRPVNDVRLERIIQSIVDFKRGYPGHLGIQMMITPVNVHEVEEFGQLLNRVRPREVQLNTPTRPYPREWVLQTRGSHDGVDYSAKPLKTITRKQLRRIETRLGELTGLDIKSVYGAS